MLNLENIHTFRGTAHVLQGISLTVNTGEAVCLVGRNGAGKTTTIESIMALLPIRSGKITLAEREITKLPAHERARLGIGYAPEDAGIFPDLTVAENFLISGWLTKAAGRPGMSSSDSEMQDRLLALFPEARTFMQRRGLNLSGGQRRWSRLPGRWLSRHPSFAEMSSSRGSRLWL